MARCSGHNTRLYVCGKGELLHPEGYNRNSDLMMIAQHLHCRSSTVHETNHACRKILFLNMLALAVHKHAQ